MILLIPLYLGKSKIRETEHRMHWGIVGGAVGGHWTLVDIWFQFYKMKRSLETDRCSIGGLHLIPLNCTPKMANVVNFMLCMCFTTNF